MWWNDKTMSQYMVKSTFQYEIGISFLYIPGISHNLYKYYNGKSISINVGLTESGRDFTIMCKCWNAIGKKY